MKKNIYYIIALLLFSGYSNKLFAQVPKQKAGSGQKKHQFSLKDVHAKEIVTEFPCKANATIFLENIMRRVNIVTSNDNKVKLVTTVYYQGEPAFTDEQWLEKLELSIKGTVSGIYIKSGDLYKPGTKATELQIPSRDKTEIVSNAITIFNGLGNRISTTSTIKRNIVLYIPSGAKLDIESKYADITLENKIQQIKIQITNGDLSMQDVERLTVISNYGTVSAGNIANADIAITNGKLVAKNVASLDINSKNSTIDLGKIDQMKITSQVDQFEIEAAGSISGQKNYGDMRIATLLGTLDITGINADINIRGIDPAVTLVKITDQYADIRLPVGGINNFGVNFEGESTKLYTTFERSKLSSTAFKASVGTPNSKKVLFQVKCDYCTVDFR